MIEIIDVFCRAMNPASRRYGLAFSIPAIVAFFLLAATAPPLAGAAASQGLLALVTSSPPALGSQGQSALWRATPDGAAKRLLVKTGATALSNPALSPDQQHIAYVVDGQTLWQMNADGTQARQLYAAPAGSFNRLLNPRYMAGGTAVAFTVGCCGKFTVYSIGIDGKHLHPIAGAGGPRILQDWLPSGKHALYSMNGALWTTDASGQHASALGGDALDAGNFLTARYSPDGSHIVAALIPAQGEEATATEIALLHSDGQYLTSLTKDLAYDVGMPSWSPDGKSIAFCVGSGKPDALGRQHDLWIMKYDGKQKRNVTRGKLGDVVEAVWAR